MRGKWIFQPPVPFEELTEKQRVQYLWVSRNIHLIHWNEGYLPYSKFRSILLLLSEIFPRIYVKGLEKTKFFEYLIGRKCYNLEDINCPKIEHLIPTHSTCDVHATDFKHCALAKVIAYGKFLESV